MHTGLTATAQHLTTLTKNLTSEPWQTIKQKNLLVINASHLDKSGTFVHPPVPAEEQLY